MNNVPAAGPYYVASYTPRQGAVLKRNPNYHGSRPHRLDEIDYRVGIGRAQISTRSRTARPTSAWWTTFRADSVSSLAARYGSKKPGRPSRRTTVLRPLTARRREPRPEHEPTVVRKRRAAQSGELRARPPGDRPAYRPLATATDQYLQPGIPGFRDTHVYPLRRDLARAKRLARGHGGHAVLYACAKSACPRSRS